MNSQRQSILNQIIQAAGLATATADRAVAIQDVALDMKGVRRKGLLVS
jgi:hypothetical protein